MKIGQPNLSERIVKEVGCLRLAEDGSLAVIRGADRRRIRRLDLKRSCPVHPVAA
jgi:hypothetical protein